MALMTLETEKGLPDGEQVPVYRTMRVMAVQTILRHIGMLIQKRAPFLRVALDAGFLDAVFLEILPGKTAMRIVAVHTENPAFFQGMVTGQGKFNLSGLVAGKTEPAGGPGGDLQIRPGMHIMAVEAGDLIH